MCELSPIPFHGDTIFCVEHENQPFAPMRPIIENMGLSWQTQARKLRESKERWGVFIMNTPSEGGEQQTLCMPVRKLPAFLASINPKKVRPELREKIELYQTECDDALWAYWTEGRAERLPQPESTPAIPLPLSTAESRKPLRALVHAWAQMARQSHANMWAQVKGHFQLSRIDDMPEEWIPDALAFVQSRIDALPPAEQLALPQGQTQPMYRNGYFYLPPINENHKAGPREEAFMDLWRQWDGRVRAIKDLFNSLVRDIDHRRGDLFSHAISDLGRNADTMFSTDSLTEALYAAHAQAKEDFERSLDLLFRHMRTCLNVSVAMKM